MPTNRTDRCSQNEGMMLEMKEDLAAHKIQNCYRGFKSIAAAKRKRALMEQSRTERDISFTVTIHSVRYTSMKTSKTDEDVGPSKDKKKDKKKAAKKDDKKKGKDKKGAKGAKDAPSAEDDEEEANKKRLKRGVRIEFGIPLDPEVRGGG